MGPDGLKRPSPRPKAGWKAIGGPVDLGDRVACAEAGDFGDRDGPMDGFTAWLLQHATDQGSTGELARRAAADPGWPEGPDRLQTFTDHLERGGATRTALQDLTDAWIRYASR